MVHDAHPIDPSKDRRWEELFGDSLAMRLADGEPARSGQAPLFSGSPSSPSARRGDVMTRKRAVSKHAAVRTLLARITRGGSPSSGVVLERLQAPVVVHQL